LLPGTRGPWCKHCRPHGGVGPTHGGFYGHFASKDALIAEAITHRLEESRKLLVKLGGRAPEGGRPLEVIIDTYLSIPHRDNVATGCPLPMLGADIARGKRRAKAALSAKVKEIVAALEAFAAAGGSDDREAVAIGVLSGMIGGMVLARATDDEQCSDEILRSCREFLKQAVAKSGGGSDGGQGD